MKKFILITMAIAISEMLHAATYYVAKTGNNTNPGTLASPWLTIQKGANTAVAGDTVYVANGTYNEQVTVQNSGSSGNYISFISTNTRGAIIDGTGLSIFLDDNGFGEGLFQIFGKSYIKIIGFAIKNSPSVGIFVRDESSTYPNNIIIQNNYTYNTKSSGIIIRTGSGHIVDGNEIELASNGGTPAQGTSQEIISIQGIEGVSGSGVSNSEIKNNIVHDGGNPTDGGEGITYKVGCNNGKIHHNTVYNVVSTGIYVDARGLVSTNIEIYDNVVHDVNRRWGQGITVGAELGGTIDNMKIYNNIVYNCDYDGISTPTANYNATIKNIYIMNNTVYNNGLGSATMGGIAIQVWFTNPTIQNVCIFNNIVFNNKSFQIAYGSTNVSGLTVTDNIVYPFRGWSSSPYSEIKGTNPTESDPQFVSTSTPDFHLKNTSPAINKGLSSSCSVSAPSLDFEGNTRPQGAGFDIGAFEYVTATAVECENEASNSFIIYPNPAQGKAQIEFELVAKENVQITPYNVLGEELGTVANSEMSAGTHRLDISDFLSGAGVYFIRVKAGNSIINRKLINFKPVRL